MLIHELKLTHFRGLLSADIKFRPGFNLIVGLNGTGKSSILDALRILISQVISQFTPAPRFNFGIEDEDIMFGRASTQAQISFSCHDSGPYIYVIHKNIEEHIPTASESLRSQTSDTPNKSELFSYQQTNGVPNEYKKRSTQPLVLYFSVERSRTTDQSSKIGIKANPAYFSAFNRERGLRIQDLAKWWRAKEEIAKEAPEGISAKQLNAVKRALNQLLPEILEWRIENKQILVTKISEIEILDPELKNGQTRRTQETRTLRIEQLSDGERSMAVLVFDLTRRLAQLNESSEDPAATGTGVVLIDEIDLHLHPAWQRRITRDLPRIFPCLQFIATTHSPQVIGETKAGHAMVLHQGGKTEVLDESLGRDSGWILRHVMGTSERNVDLQTGIDEIEKLIEEQEFTSARTKATALRKIFGDDKALVGAIATIDSWENLGNEED